jgi:hypothetical protein
MIDDLILVCERGCGEVMAVVRFAFACISVRSCHAGNEMAMTLSYFLRRFIKKFVSERNCFELI